MSGRDYEFCVRKLGEKPLAPGASFFVGATPSCGRGKSMGTGLNLPKQAGNSSAFTLVETMISIVIITMFFSTILLGYTRAEQRAQWAGYSLAAQALSTRQLEEFRSVLWDTQSTPITDNTTNVPTNLVLALDLPISGTNVVYATNIATVTTISNFGNSAQVKMIVIHTIWPFNGTTFTNTIVDYRAPDQ